MLQVIWILVNCNSKKEAEFIGGKILKKRLVSCFDIIPRHLTTYWWPPKSGKIETSKGATFLVLETFSDKYNFIVKEVKRLHSDKLPFVGFIEMRGVTEEYIDWIKGELR